MKHEQMKALRIQEPVEDHNIIANGITFEASMIQIMAKKIKEGRGNYFVN